MKITNEEVWRMSAFINKMLNLVGFENEEDLMEEEETVSNVSSKYQETTKESTSPFKKNQGKLRRLIVFPDFLRTLIKICIFTLFLSCF